MITTCYNPQKLFWKKHHIKIGNLQKARVMFWLLKKGLDIHNFTTSPDMFTLDLIDENQRPRKWRIRPVWWTPFCLCQVAVKFSVAKNQVLGPKKDRVDVDAFWKPKKTLHFNESTDLRFTIFYEEKQKCQHTSAIKILPPAKKSSLLQIHRWLGQPGGFSSLWVPSSAFCQCALHCSRLLPHF